MSALIFDLETTGLFKPFGIYPHYLNFDQYDPVRMVSIGWAVSPTVVSSPPAPAPPPVHYHVHKPTFTIPNPDFHGISQVEAETTGLTISQILDLGLREAIHHCFILVNHNIDFDRHILASEIARVDPSLASILMSKPIWCTMKATTDWCQLPWKYGFKYPSLKELYEKVTGRPITNAHHAGGDVQSVVEILAGLPQHLKTSLNLKCASPN